MGRRGRRQICIPWILFFSSFFLRNRVCMVWRVYVWRVSRVRVYICMCVDGWMDGRGVATWWYKQTGGGGSGGGKINLVVGMGWDSGGGWITLALSLCVKRI